MESILPVMVTVEWSLPGLISTKDPFVIFSLLCPSEGGSDRVAFVGIWHPTQVNPPHPAAGNGTEAEVSVMSFLALW